MTTKIGFHVSSQSGINSGWLSRLDSTIHLVLAAGAGGEIPRTLEAAARAPGARIIYRAWTLGDVGHSDHFPEYYARHGADPLPLIRLHEPCFAAFAGLKDRVAYQLFNETGMEDGVWPKFVEFNTHFVQEMDRRGLSASVIGCGPGFPTGTREEIRAKWQMARPLFEAINAAQQPHFINLHEYVGYPYVQWIPYLAGRYHWLLEDLQEMGLLTDKIRIYAGENGWADPAVLNPTYPPNPANGYRGFITKGITPHQLAQDVVLASQTVYADLHFVGLCLFCLGDSGGWAEFDLLQEPGILEEIERLTKEVIVIPDITETPATLYKVVNGPLNVRALPSITAQKVGSLGLGMDVETNGYADADGMRWRRLVNGTGYCAEYADSEPGAPFLATAPDWKIAVLAQIKAMRAQLAQLEAAIQAV